MFEKIITAPADPILGLTEVFNADTRPEKINLGVGVYKDESGATPVLATVKEAEARLLANEKSKNYLPIEGNRTYNAQVQKLLFGSDSAIIADQRARTVQSPGGTGALRLIADFVANNAISTRVWISDPTWNNHIAIFEAAGLEVKRYRYYDAAANKLDFVGMQEDLAKAQAGDLVLFHACCHNPTGIDPTAEQWQMLAEQSLAAGWLPLFDFAYQGFGFGLNEDAYAVRLFAEKHSELLIASSFSKNIGLYNERVGAFTLVAANDDEAERAFSQMKIVVRTNFSSPPAHGAAVVATVLDDTQLAAQWEGEVTEMRERIRLMRELLVQKLKQRGVTRDLSFITEQNGMFSYSGLSLEQVKRLKEEFGIYILGSGRISVAGITKNNIDRLCDALAQVF